MIVNAFHIFSILSILLWLVAILFAYRNKGHRTVTLVYLAGTMVFASFIVQLWMEIGRPPMRTMGEVRLWYIFFLSLTGTILYVCFRFRWMLLVSTLLSSVFIIISTCKPELFDTSLMPALRSQWFVPHVTVYIFSYSILTIATVLSFFLMLGKGGEEEKRVCNLLVHVGWALLTAGMVMGALWAKQAWGDYWTWDPKETWAAATWISYLVYIHTQKKGLTPRQTFLLLLFSFLLLQMCWYGVNFLPSAQGSIHSYS